MDWDIAYKTRVWVTILLAVVVTAMITIVAISFRRKEWRRRHGDILVKQPNSGTVAKDSFKSVAKSTSFRK